LELQSLQSVDVNLSQINSIRGQARRIFHDVQQLLSSINRFNDTLGTRAARGFHHGTFAKIKWSQCVAPKVKELRKTVHLQTTNIQTLLSLLIQHNQNLDRTLFTRTLAQQSLSIDGLAEKVKSFELNLRQNPNPADEKVTNKVIVDKTCIEDYDGRTNLVSHLPALSSDSPSTSSEQTDATIITQSSESNIATSDDLRRLETLIKSCFQDKMPGSGRRPHRHTEEISLVRLNLSLSVSTENIRSIIHYLNAKFDAIFQHLVRFLFVVLKEMLPHVLVFLKVLQQIPRAVSLVLEDNIRFEDALGRIQSLQYQHFKHWTVFEACLRCTFINTPGMQKVLQGQFVLICPSVAKSVLDATNWEKYASPGMAVTMSMSISTILTPSGRCPRGCVARRTAVSSSEFRCTACDLTFSVRHAPQEDIYRTLTFIGTRSRPRAVRDIRKRKRPGDHPIKSEQQRNRQRRESAASRLTAQLNIDQAEVPKLMRYESFYKEKEDHRLEMQEITHFKRVQLVENTVMKWTWIFNHPYNPWHWGWYVELPEVRAEWKTAHFWETISPHLDGQREEDDHPSYRRPGTCLDRLRAEKRALGFSQDAQASLPSFRRTYTLTYTGSLSLNDSFLAVTKIPFIHLLATRPLSPRRLRQILGMAKYNCDQLITIFARDCPSDPEKKELLELSYRELDVWGFPYHNEIERQSAIENSIVAFDTLGIDPHDDLWQLLLPVDERGKGICLSKRNFG
jgi:hypothetical protein